MYHPGRLPGPQVKSPGLLPTSQQICKRLNKAVDIICIASDASRTQVGSAKPTWASPACTQDSVQAKGPISYLLPKGNSIYFLHLEKKKRFIYLKQSRPNSCLTQVGQKCPMYFRLSASPCPGTWLSCLLSWLHGRTIWRTRVQAQCLTLASQPPWTPLGQEDGGFLSHVYLPQGGGVGWDLNWEILVSLAWRTDTWPVTYMVQI